MTTIDSHGSSALGDRRQSPLLAFTAAVGGPQVHLGKAGAVSVNRPISRAFANAGNVLFASTSSHSTNKQVTWVHIASIAIGENAGVNLLGDTASFTATSNDPVAAAAGLRAACAAKTTAPFLEFTWTSSGQHVYGDAVLSSTQRNFNYVGNANGQLINLTPTSQRLCRSVVLPDLSGMASMHMVDVLGSGGVGYFDAFFRAGSDELHLFGDNHVIITPTSGAMAAFGSPVINAFDKTSSILFFFNDAFRREVDNSGGAINESGYIGVGVFSSVVSDGSNYFIVTSHDLSGKLCILKIDSAYAVVSAFTYTDELGSGLNTGPQSGAGPHAQYSDDTIVIYCTRSGGNPLTLGIKASDLSVVRWAKTSKKQISTATILVNDTASTYRITIAGQTVSVAGNAGGANSTATDLKNACAASVLSEFTKRTWTVATNVVTGTANVAGVTFVLSTSVVSGTGTMSSTNAPFTSEFLPSSTSVFGGEVYVGGTRNYPGAGSGFAARRIDADTGVYAWTLATNEQPDGINILKHALVDGSETYFLGDLADPAVRFGNPDIEILHLPAYANNLTDLEDAITITVTEVTDITEDENPEPGDQPMISGMRVVSPPALSIDVTNYTF